MFRQTLGKRLEMLAMTTIGIPMGTSAVNQEVYLLDGVVSLQRPEMTDLTVGLQPATLSPVYR